ncbi:MAG: hypothetical protein ABI643_02020 [Candidatus Doudnabacteria bacterium]
MGNLKHKAIVIAMLAITANILFANFALGQAPATSTPATTSTITKQMLLDALQSQSACASLSTAISNLTPARGIGSYITFWDPSAAQKCSFQRIYRFRADGSPDTRSDASTVAAWEAYMKQDESLINSFVTTTQKNDATVAKLNAQETQANPLSIFIAWVLIPIFGVVNAFLAGIAVMAGAIFNQAIIPVISITTMPTIVNTGWMIVRDVCNMFFILALIVIALGMILRLKEYQEYGTLLRNLIIAAILVNFSQVIAVTIMNAVNFLASVFWGDGTGIVHVFATFMRIANPVGDFSLTIQGGAPAELALGLGRLTFMLVATVVFIALAGMFVIRLVGLYVLIIFSPVAFVANILPVSKKFAEQWWSSFFKYLIWAPVALFMLRLVILVVDNDSQFNFIGGGGHDSVFIYFILTAFIGAALLLAQKAGMVGSDMVVNAAKATGKFGLHAADRKLASWSDSSSRVKKGLSYLSFGAAKKGYELRQHHKEEESYTVAAGKRANTFAAVMSGGREKGDFERLARYQRVAQEKKRFENITDKDELTAIATHAYENKEYDKFMGAWSKLAAQGDMNEVALAMVDKEASAENVQKIVQKMVDETGNKEWSRLAADTTKIAEGQGDYIFAGAFERDGKTGDYGARGEDERRNYVNTQRAKNSDQSNVRNLGRRGLGFIEANGINPNTAKSVWYVKKIEADGTDYASRLKDISGWRNNGNKNAKANVAISGSKEWLEANPEAWAAAASEYAELDKDKSTAGRERLVEFRKSVAAPNIEENYNTPSTVSPAQAKIFFESKEIGRQIKAKIESGDQKDKEATRKDYGVLYDYAYGSSPTRTPSTTPFSTPTPTISPSGGIRPPTSSPPIM